MSWSPRSTASTPPPSPKEGWRRGKRSGAAVLATFGLGRLIGVPDPDCLPGCACTVAVMRAEQPADVGKAGDMLPACMSGRRARTAARWPIQIQAHQAAGNDAMVAVARLSVPIRLDVAEEPAALDELGDFRGDHAFPGVVARHYPPQHVAAEDRQPLGPVVVEVNETAPSGEVVIERLQLLPDPDVIHGPQLVLW